MSFTLSYVRSIHIFTMTPIMLSSAKNAILVHAKLPKLL